MIVHTPCGQPHHRHINADCPDLTSPAWHSTTFIPDRAAIAAWATSHTALNTAIWLLAICVFLTVTASLIGIER